MSLLLLILIPGAVVLATGCFDVEIDSFLLAVAWFVWTLCLLSGRGL